jgi:hypothetical protein
MSKSGYTWYCPWLEIQGKVFVVGVSGASGASGASAAGDRGSSMGGSGTVDVASLVTSVAPLLHHLAEALQNGPPLAPPPPPPPQVLSFHTICIAECTSTLLGCALTMR